MWEIEIRHEGLNKYRYIKGVDKYIVEQKALAQRLAWEELWQKKLINEYNKQAKIDSARNKDEKKELAALRTFEANNLIGKLQNILIFSLSVQHEFSWRDLIDNSSYSEPKPEISKYKEIPLPPDLSDAEFKPKLNLLHRIFKGLREEKIKAADKKFERAYGFWVLEKSKIEKQNLEIQSENSKMMKDWETGKQLFDSQREVINNSYLEKEEAYLANDSEMLLEYCGIVLLNSEYPEFFPKEWDLEYVEESKTLIVDYELPSLEILPNLKSVKYVASTDSFVETFYTESPLVY